MIVELCRSKRQEDDASPLAAAEGLAAIEALEKVPSTRFVPPIFSDTNDCRLFVWLVCCKRSTFAHAQFGDFEGVRLQTKAKEVQKAQKVRA